MDWRGAIQAVVSALAAVVAVDRMIKRDSQRIAWRIEHVDADRLTKGCVHMGQLTQRAKAALQGRKESPQHLDMAGELSSVAVG